MHHYISLKSYLVITLILSPFSLTGCGKTPGGDRVTGAVEITVSFSGNPLDQGSVQLTIPEKGKSTGAELNEMGKASLPEVEVGKYKVFITPPEGTPDAPLSQEVVKLFEEIPDSYLDPEKSGFVAEVKKGPNSFTFELINE